jgi:hypothetical protein
MAKCQIIVAIGYIHASSLYTH